MSYHHHKYYGTLYEISKWTVLWNVKKWRKRTYIYIYNIMSTQYKYK